MKSKNFRTQPMSVSDKIRAEKYKMKSQKNEISKNMKYEKNEISKKKSIKSQKKGNLKKNQIKKFQNTANVSVR